MKFIFRFVFLGFMLFSFSCSNTNNEQAVDSNDTSKSNQEKRERVNEDDFDEVAFIFKRFAKRGVSLSQSQKDTIKAKADKVDLSGESRYERRIKLKDFFDELVETELTDEQEAQYRNRFQ